MAGRDDKNPWVIRTDFSDNEKWKAVCELIAAPRIEYDYQFYACVQYVSDPKYAGMEHTALVHSLPGDYSRLFIFVVDLDTLTNDEYPVLVVGFSPNSPRLEDYQRPPRKIPVDDIRTFRAIPSTVQSIENNLSIANMDFEEFAESVDADGVFRGFPR